MTVQASIRNLWGEEQPAELEDGVDLPPGVVAVRVPGLGHLIVGRHDDEWRAVLAQEHGTLWRDVSVIGDRVEVELLPNGSGEDRIVVCVDGLAGG